jgi:hypothetical protein
LRAIKHICFSDTIFPFTVKSKSKGPSDHTITKRTPVATKPSASTKSMSGLLCSGCGHPNHLVATCRFKLTKFFNSSPYSYKGSKARKLLQETSPDDTSIPFSELQKIQTTSSSSGSASTKSGPKPAGKSDIISDILDTICNDISDKNYIDVSVSAKLHETKKQRQSFAGYGLLSRRFRRFSDPSGSTIGPLYFDQRVEISV